MQSLGDVLEGAGWTPHTGGECPVDGADFVIVLCADGSNDCERAEDFQWVWGTEYPGDNVIAWKNIGD